MLDHLWRCVEEEGREPKEVEVSMSPLGCAPPGGEGFDAQQHLDVLGALAELGVTWTSTSVPGDSLDRALEALEQYGTTVVTPSHPA